MKIIFLSLLRALNLIPFWTSTLSTETEIFCKKVELFLQKHRLNFSRFTILMHYDYQVLRDKDCKFASQMMFIMVIIHFQFRFLLSSSLSYFFASTSSCVCWWKSGFLETVKIKVEGKKWEVAIKYFFEVEWMMRRIALNWARIVLTFHHFFFLFCKIITGLPGTAKAQVYI